MYVIQILWGKKTIQYASEYIAALITLYISSLLSREATQLQSIIFLESHRYVNPFLLLGTC